MSERQEIDDTVFFIHRHTPVVCFQCRTVHPVGQHDALALPRRTARVKNIADIIFFRRRPAFLDFRFPRQSLAQLQEIFKVNAVGVMRTDTHARIEDDDAFQRRTECGDTVRLVVLLLLACKKKSYACILNHVLYLLL